MSYHAARQSHLGVALNGPAGHATGPDVSSLPPRARADRMPGLRSSLRRLALLLAGALLLTLGLYLLSPLLVKSLAGNLPTNWIHGSSERILATLDSEFLQPSQTDIKLQNDLRSRFASLNAPPGGTPPYRLIFRHSRAATPVLLSLPSGDIIVTDQLLKRVQTPEQQLALLCQQLGHLQHQHALHNAIAHKLLWLATAALAGSAEHSIDALADGLMNTAFSAKQLIEADRFAVAMLEANGLPRQLLKSALAEHAANGAAGRLSNPSAVPSHLEQRLHALQAQPLHAR